MYTSQFRVQCTVYQCGLFPTRESGSSPKWWLKYTQPMIRRTYRLERLSASDSISTPMSYHSLQVLTINFSRTVLIGILLKFFEFWLIKWSIKPELWSSTSEMTAFVTEKMHKYCTSDGKQHPFKWPIKDIINMNFLFMVKQTTNLINICYPIWTYGQEMNS